MRRSNERKSINDFYKIVNGERSENDLYWLCIYCGQPATQRDHAPPISRFYDYKSLGLINEQLFLVPCCSSCNSHLSNSLQESIFQRIEHAKDLILKKHAMHAKAMEWDKWEVEELGRNLRSYITSEMRKSQIVRRRLEYYGGYEAIMDYLNSESGEE